MSKNYFKKGGVSAVALKVSRPNLMIHNKKRAKTYSKAPNSAVIAKIKSILEQRPSYGYKRITALLKADQKNNSPLHLKHTVH